MRVLEGRVANGRVVVDGSVDLPEGSEILVAVFPLTTERMTPELRTFFHAYVAETSARVAVAREVPEIREGRVEIVAVARRVGRHTKVAVRSLDEDVDPVGAVVGEDGERIKRIRHLLGDPLIDVVPWDDNAAMFVCNALAPLEIARVIIDEENRAMDMFVPDEPLAAALDSDQLPVQLAAQLTGWRINLYGLSRYRSPG